MKFSGMIPVAVAALIGGAAVAFGSGSASAMSMPSPTQAAGDRASADLVQHVDHRRYDRHRHGQRYRERRGRYRHYHGGYWYAEPWWSIGVPGFVIGVPAPWSPGWYDYCYRTYPGFNRRTGKYRNRHGQWVVCH